MHCIWLSHHISLLNLKLLNLVFQDLDIFLSIVQLFVEYPSIWICVMFSHFQIHIMDFWQEHLRGDMVI